MQYLPPKQPVYLFYGHQLFRIFKHPTDIYSRNQDSNPYFDVSGIGSPNFNEMLTILTSHGCDNHIDISYVRNVMQLYMLNTTKYDSIFLLTSDINTQTTNIDEFKNTFVSFMIIEKGECEKFPEVWTLNLICSKKSFNVGYVLLELYIYSVCHKYFMERQQQPFGLLELADGHANVNGLCLYSKYGFKEDQNFYSDQYSKCFDVIFNLPMVFNAQEFISHYNGPALPQMSIVVELISAIRYKSFILPKPNTCHVLQNVLQSRNRPYENDFKEIQLIHGYLENLKRIYFRVPYNLNFKKFIFFVMTDYANMIQMFYSNQDRNDYIYHKFGNIDISAINHTLQNIYHLHVTVSTLDEGFDSLYLADSENFNKITTKINYILDFILQLSTGQIIYNEHIHQRYFKYFLDNVRVDPILESNRLRHDNNGQPINIQLFINSNNLPIDRRYNCWYTSFSNAISTGGNKKKLSKRRKKKNNKRKKTHRVLVKNVTN